MSVDHNQDESLPPVRPAFPTTALIAGIMWIVLGSWIFLMGALVLSVERPGAQTPLSFWGFVFGAASVYIGIHTVRGTVRGMRGNAIGSIVFACLILIHVSSVVAAIQPDKSAEILFGHVVQAGGAFVVALGFLAAGILALWGRHQYQSWLQAQKASKSDGEPQ